MSSEKIASLIKNAKNIVVLTGAGVSTSAGIPDFRSPETGLYANLEKYNLPYPEAIFELSYFYRKPQPFFTLASALYPGNFSPTLTHAFCVLLHNEGKLKRCYTQNIDTLDHQAGLPKEKIVEAHGSFAAAHCLNCKAEYSAEDIKPQVLKGEIVRCSRKGCHKKENALVKPDITFFGEGLPERFFKLTSTDFRDCDLLITIGTSLKVHPFAGLIDMVSDKCPRVLINAELVGEMDDFEPSGMFGRYRETGFDFDGRTCGGKDKTRDFAWIGKCDEACESIAKELDWQNKLDKIYKACQAKPGKEADVVKDEASDTLSRDHEPTKAEVEKLTARVGEVLDLKDDAKATDEQKPDEKSPAKAAANL